MRMKVHASLMKRKFLDLRISVKENSVFGAFHPDAHDLYNACSDLKKVAWTLCDPNKRLNEDVSICISCGQGQCLKYYR